MADYSVTMRRLLVLWIVTSCCAVIAGVVAIFLPTWIHVTHNVTTRQGAVWSDDVIVSVDVGLWETCSRMTVENSRIGSNETTGKMEFNCTKLDQNLVAGWYREVQVLSVCGFVLSCCAAACVCALVVFGNCRLAIRPHTTLAGAITSTTILSGLAKLATCVMCGIKSSHSLLPVCITWCPAHQQPMTSCVNDVDNSTVTCQQHLGSGYVISVTSLGLVVLCAAISLTVLYLVSRENPAVTDDDEQFLREDINSPEDDIGPVTSNDVIANH